MSLLHRFDRFLFQRSRQRILNGIAVRTLWLSGRDAEAAFEKVAVALELIQKYSPRDFSRLRCLVKGIWVGGCIENLGEWYSALGLVNLQLKYVRSEATLPAAVASTLVHEATHAWLDHLGIRYLERDRARIEAICVRSERAFARRLPDAGELLEEIEWKLSRDPTSWTDYALAHRKLDELRELGAPGWLVQICEWRLRRRFGERDR